MRTCRDSNLPVCLIYYLSSFAQLLCRDGQPLEFAVVRPQPLVLMVMHSHIVIERGSSEPSSLWCLVSEIFPDPASFP